MRDRTWNVEKATLMPPQQDTDAIDRRSVSMSAASAELGFLSAEHTDSKITEELQAPKATVDVARHRFILDTARQFDKAVPHSFDLQDLEARTKEHRSVISYANVVAKHLKDVNLEARARGVNMCQESESLAIKILEAASQPDASPDTRAAAAQLERYQRDTKIREKMDESRIDRIKEGANKDTEILRARTAQLEMENLELRRQLALRTPPEAPPTPPNPHANPPASPNGRYIPR